jgi:hypothetical protein
MVWDEVRFTGLKYLQLHVTPANARLDYLSYTDAGEVAAVTRRNTITRKFKAPALHPDKENRHNLPHE